MEFTGDEICGWGGEDEDGLHRGEPRFFAKGGITQSALSSSLEFRRNSKEIVDMNDMLMQKHYVELPSVSLTSPNSASDGMLSSSASASNSSVDLKSPPRDSHKAKGTDQNVRNQKTHDSRARAELKKALADASILDENNDKPKAKLGPPKPKQLRTKKEPAVLTEDTKSNNVEPPQKSTAKSAELASDEEVKSKNDSQPRNSPEVNSPAKPTADDVANETDTELPKKLLYVNGCSDLEWFEVPSQAANQQIASSATGPPKKKKNRGDYKANEPNTFGPAESTKVIPEKKKPILDISLEAWKKENEATDDAVIAVSSTPSDFGNFVEWRQTKLLRVRSGGVGPNFSRADSDVRSVTAASKSKRNTRSMPLCATMAPPGDLRNSWTELSSKPESSGNAGLAAVTTVTALPAVRTDTKAGLRLIQEEKVRRRREHRRLQRERLQQGKAAWDPTKIQQQQEGFQAPAAIATSPKGGPTNIQLKKKF